MELVVHSAQIIAATYKLTNIQDNTESTLHSAKINAATYNLMDTQANTESAVYSAEIQYCHLQSDGYPGQHRISCALC
jgi:hypothetical protein